MLDVQTAAVSWQEQRGIAIFRSPFLDPSPFRGSSADLKEGCSAIRVAAECWLIPWVDSKRPSCPWPPVCRFVTSSFQHHPMSATVATPPSPQGFTLTHWKSCAVALSGTTLRRDRSTLSATSVYDQGTRSMTSGWREGLQCPAVTHSWPLSDALSLTQGCAGKPLWPLDQGVSSAHVARPGLVGRQGKPNCKAAVGLWTLV